MDELFAAGALMPESNESLQMWVFAAIDDLARCASAEARVAHQGEAAAAALDAYLARPAASVSQARRFAVAMLARIAGTQTTAMLHRHPLE
jgi:hypothetical protein